MKMLFSAKFKDGTVYRQNDQDISVVDPSRNCFYDVLAQERLGNPPIQFELIDDKNSYLVNLIDGHFEINGVLFLLHSHPIEDLKLVYYRTRCCDMTVGFQVTQDRVESYTLGWQKRGSSEESKTITIK